MPPSNQPRTKGNLSLLFGVIVFRLDAGMPKSNKKEHKVIWETVEDPDFEEHLRRVFEIILRDEPGSKERSAEERPSSDASSEPHSP